MYILYIISIKIENNIPIIIENSDYNIGLSIIKL